MNSKKNIAKKSLAELEKALSVGYSNSIGNARPLKIEPLRIESLERSIWRYFIYPLFPAELKAVRRKNAKSVLVDHIRFRSPYWKKDRTYWTVGRGDYCYFVERGKKKFSCISLFDVGKKVERTENIAPGKYIIHFQAAR